MLSVAAATSPLALSHFLEGLAQANRPGPTHQERAVALLEEANRVEGVFPAALGAIAECRMYQATWGYISAREARRRVTKACRRALQADRHLASALCVKGWAQGVLERNYDAGLQTIDAVIGDHPFYAKAHVYRSLVLRSAGRVEECVAAARQAREIDPHSHLIQHALAWGLFCARKTRQALNIERAIARSRPEDTLSHTYIGVMSAYLGRHREAVAACRRAYDISNENPTVATALTYALAQSGEQEEARRLAAVALGCRKPEVLRPHLAMTFVALGDFETAIRLLLEAHDMGCPTAPSALVDPRLGPLAADPRLTCLRDRRHRRLTFS